jgi:hypothetical protein
VIIECYDDLKLEPLGEGCMTRYRRNALLLDQQDNARVAAFKAFDELARIGEYENYVE